MVKTHADSPGRVIMDVDISTLGSLVQIQLDL